MEPVKPPDHLAITGRIQRIRNYLQSPLASGKEASSVLHREKNEPVLYQGPREAISEHDARWKHSDDLVVNWKNWGPFKDFADYVLRNS